MKARIERLKKDTFKILSSCFGLVPDAGANDLTIKGTRIKSPDFYDSRISAGHRKDPGSSHVPR